MPNSHFHIQMICKSQGQSVVAAAAYRSGEIIHSEKAGKTFDYSRKEDVVHTEIMAPAGAPAWASDRALLWNKVEAVEGRKNAQLARSIIAGLPRELDHQQNLELVRSFAQEAFVSKRMIVDFAIHESEASDGLKNPHVHILLTLREVNQDGFSTHKNREWNHHSQAEVWRESWERMTNKALESAGRTERVNLKSYEKQGINKHPTIHLGEDAGNLEKRGIETLRGNYNRRAQHENNLIAMLEPDSEDRNRKPEARSMDLQVSEKQVTLGAFRKQEDDLEKLAVSSLAASKSVHDAALREHLASASPHSLKEPVIQKIKRQENTRWNTEKDQEAQRHQEREEDRER